MQIVELAFSDSDERLRARAAHRARLTALQADGLVRLAGPLSDDSGAVIVFDLPDREALDRVMDQDPYFRTPGVTVKSIRSWSPFLT